MNNTLKKVRESLQELVDYLSDQQMPITGPFAAMERARELLASLDAAASEQAEPETWRCFHCDEVFTDREQAALHFGTTQMQKPACQFDVAALRETEALMRRYQEEDTDLHRQIYGMQAKHNADLQRAEEQGYARGLKDAGYTDHPAQAQAVPMRVGNECVWVSEGTMLPVHIRHDGSSKDGGSKDRPKIFLAHAADATAHQGVQAISAQSTQTDELSNEEIIAEVEHVVDVNGFDIRDERDADLVESVCIAVIRSLLSSRKGKDAELFGRIVDEYETTGDLGMTTLQMLHAAIAAQGKDGAK